MVVRLFVAIALPQAVQHEIMRIHRVLHKQDLFAGSYVKPEQAHITMKFIGDVDTDLIPHINDALRAVPFEPCQARVGNLGVFVAGHKVKVVYLAVVAPALVTLAADLDVALTPWCAAETRDFVPHITIARVKRIEDRQRLCKSIEQLHVEPLTFTINGFVLKQSVLTQQGAEHTTVHTYP